MKPFSRSDRVSGLIRQVIAETLRRKIKDPRLKDIIISGVKMSPDLKIARVYYVTSGGDEAVRRAEDGFKKATGFFKKGPGTGIDIALHSGVELFL
jgi:ribosome-binding factor A